jgi:hypothetical protein
MAGKHSIWYHIGHALERARHTEPARRAVTGLAERKETKKSVAERDDERPAIPSADELMTAGAAVVVDRVLATWSGRKAPGLTRLIRAGAAGAAAALLVDLVRPLVTGERDRRLLDEGTTDRLLAGAGQGLVYGVIVEPRLPGPAVMKGAVYGSAEYWADPVGGLSGLLGGHAPQRHLPVLGDVMDALGDHERAYLEHLVFGIALALLYESRSSSSGILPDDE